jgi:hypothetical protein
MYFIKPIIEPYYHPALGIVIHGRKQLRDEMRARNLTEVGNEWKAAGVNNPHIGRTGGSQQDLEKAQRIGMARYVKARGNGHELSRAERLVREKYGNS